MTNTIQNELRRAMRRILRPLVRVMLRNGMSFKEFAELSKQVFVDVAMHEFQPDRKPTVSQAAVLTGLTRKDVQRLVQTAQAEGTQVTPRYNRAARVVAGWVRDSAFLNEAGDPKPLPFVTEGEGASFSELVRRHSGDMTPRAMLDELIRVSVCRQDRDGLVHLLARSYVPKGDDIEKIDILGSDVALLLKTIDHNITQSRTPRFQRKVLYDNVPTDSLRQLKPRIAKKCQRLIEELDEEIAAHDRDANPLVRGDGRGLTGVGIYYFEESLEGGSGDEENT